MHLILNTAQKEQARFDDPGPGNEDTAVLCSATQTILRYTPSEVCLLSDFVVFARLYFLLLPYVLGSGIAQ